MCQLLTLANNDAPPTAHFFCFNTCRKIWLKVKRFFRRQIEIAQTIARIRAVKKEIDAKPGTSGKESQAANSLLKFYRWRFYMGNDITKFLRISKPPFELSSLLALYAGIDLEKEIQITDEAWILDGIKLPLVASQIGGLWDNELGDIVLPSYLRRKPACVSSDRYCDTFYGYMGEGPYEYGDVYLNDGDVVFDCGANMGLFSAVASRYGAEVYAFEAIPDIIDNYLSKTASMNENIRIQNVAVWDKEETLEFSLVPDNIGASYTNQLHPQLHPHWNHNNFKQFTVPTITLDAFVEQNGIKRVDFIKADIEGAERNMLRGATRILKEFAPKLSICTYHLPDDPQVIRKIILEANPQYQIVEKFKKMYAHVPQRVSNTRTQTPHSFRKAS